VGHLFFRGDAPHNRGMKRRRTVHGQGMTEVVIIVALIAIATIGVATIFGDDIRALFGISSDTLAGETSVNRARQDPQGLEKKNLGSFGENQAYNGDHPM